MMRICIFCGSAMGNDDLYAEAVDNFVKEIATIGGSLVYGGGNVGLMGVLADSASQYGIEISGVIPEHLKSAGLSHPKLTELHIVQSMHDRKQLMSELSDAFVALPGGAGTLEEIVEQWTWAQIGLHQKACGFLNVSSYFDKLCEFIEHMTRAGFVSREHTDMLVFEERPNELLLKLALSNPVNPKWSKEII